MSQSDPASVPASRQDLFDRLDELAITTSTIEHDAVFTVAESSVLERDIAGAHTKNLFLKCKKGRLFLLVALNNAEINLKQLHKILGCGRLSFGKPELLMQVLGVRPGSVTPFSLINDRDARVTVILDEPMMREEILNYHPLENTATTSIARGDLIRFVRSCGHDPHIMLVSGPEAAEPANPLLDQKSNRRSEPWNRFDTAQSCVAKRSEAIRNLPGEDET